MFVEKFSAIEIKAFCAIDKTLLGGSELIFEDEMSENNTGFEKGVLSSTGAVSVMTGRFTGRF